MVKQQINATIFFQHDPDEVFGLNTAIVPMMDHLRAVSTSSERSKIKHILAGEYFRMRDADRMRCLLLRASRHARANLSDYFPMMREGIMDNAEHLEVAIDLYWDAFKAMVQDTEPTH